jgi:DNA-binding MarR family transcriptional regulator
LQIPALELRCGRRLYAHINELCEHLDMTRQGVTQHLDLLEAANLVATMRRGR